MNIIKSNGRQQSFNPDKIWKRIKDQSIGLKVEPDKIFQSVIPSISNGMTTTQIDEILAYKAADLTIDHPDYSILGARLLMTRQSKITGLVPEPVDLSYDFIGTVTFLEKYSVKNGNGRPIELPSTMYRRVAKFLSNNAKEEDEYYSELSSKRISLATPILTNAGTGRKILVSCNLTYLSDDSTDGILETIDSISKASREGAGIGLCIDNIRSKESNVSSFNGKAGGVVRLADMVQSHMRFFKQGSRSGSCALYLSVWHKDILDFLSLRLPIGDDTLRARDLFTAVIINDNFMRALINDEDWYLFCPNDVKQAGIEPLQDVWGDEYESRFKQAVDAGIGIKIRPKVIWDAIIKSCVETGTPYIFYKDIANRKNMQSNIGIIRQSNLCAEITEVSNPNYTAQCTLGLINLKEQKNLTSIAGSTRILTKMLNAVIDKTEWPDESAGRAGKEQRAIAIGIAGLADFLAIKKLPFTSDDARSWNFNIMKIIYSSALHQSSELAKEQGCYPAWEGSPYSNGYSLLEKQNDPIPMRNSLLVALMPSASTSILLGANEGIEPFNSNIIVRNTGSGEFIMINKYLVYDLEEIGLWNQDIRNRIIKNEGSVQLIDEIPQSIKDVYKTVMEISMKDYISMASDRQTFVDQSQSMNLYFNEADYTKISAAFRYGWESGLKTGVYYTRAKKSSEKPKRLYMAEESLPKKPENSPFECFGCSS